MKVTTEQVTTTTHTVTLDSEELRELQFELSRLLADSDSPSKYPATRDLEIHFRKELAKPFTVDENLAAPAPVSKFWEGN